MFSRKKLWQHEAFIVNIEIEEQFNAACEGLFQVGVNVLAHSLGKADLNGAEGTVIGHKGDRVVVKFPGPIGEKALKQKNLLLTTASSVGTSTATINAASVQVTDGVECGDIQKSEAGALDGCRRRVQDAGCELSPEWGNGALFLLPFRDQSKYQELLIQGMRLEYLKPYNIVALRDDEDLVKQALAQVPRRRRPQCKHEAAGSAAQSMPLASPHVRCLTQAWCLNQLRSSCPTSGLKLSARSMHLGTRRHLTHLANPALASRRRHHGDS